MTIHPDALLERAKLGSHISRWRLLALILVGALIVSLSGLDDFGGSRNHVARIAIDGIIMSDDYRDDILDELATDDSVKAVIVRIDSPGGTSIGGEILYNKLQMIADKKPMVVVMGGLATSAGYLAAVAAEHIIAYEATITGSIGVIFEMPDVQRLAEKLGINVHVVSTGPMKGQPSPLKPLSTEVEAVLQSVVDDFHDYFIAKVATRRDLPQEVVRVLADGRIYSARQALDNGLIDEIGGDESALLWLEKSKEINGLLVVDVDVVAAEDQWLQAFGAIFGTLAEQFGIIRSEGQLSIWKTVL